jgi:indolepyruvate ferredoxin oxidoreductase
MEQETIDLIKKSSFKLVSLLPASNIAARLSNDAIGSNLIMLGAAFQAGLIPLKRESIEEAIILNKVGAENNLHCFNLGRAYVQNPQQPIFANFLENSPDETLELVLSSRKKLLKDYGRKEFEKYNTSFSETRELLKNEIGSESTLVRLAKELYRLLAIKDEYQVAKFHLQNSKELISSYGNNYLNLNFYLAPPLLSFIKDKKTQRPKKFKVPAYIALPTFYLLRSLKFLRGSPLDIMKHSKDRKLALEHQKIFFEDLANISTLPEGKRLSSIAKLLSRSEKVKGFGPVREMAFKAFLSKE